MKKILSFVAILSVMALSSLMMNSCKPVEQGDVMYHISTGDFFDNMDILTYAIDEGFEKAGFTNVSTHYWKLRGEKNACNNKAKETFQNRCKEIDKDRSQASVLGIPLALKGVTVTLYYTYDGEFELDKYTFVEEDK